MKLQVIKSLWGMAGTLEEQLERIAQAGYTGVESPLPGADQENRFKELLAKHGLDYIVQIFTSGDHSESFEAQVEKATSFNPIVINSHSARDCMTDNEQDAFFEKALAVEKAAGIPIAHETHRHRAMFTPWTTARLLKEHKELKITADFSHWCCVCESLLDDQADNLKIAMERTIHVHARVGYPEGPQVPHPGAPEYSGELAKHESWWEEIYKLRKSQGAQLFTVTPEFGPPGYMHTLPYTNQPVSDLWEVNLWMAKRWKVKYQ